MENKSIDHSWDFKTSNTKYSTHGFHSYPAMMIPQIARRLIEKYSKKYDTILDPFCGSGTVLVESKILSRNVWGIDINPLALLLSKVKTTPISPVILENEFRNLINKIENDIRDLNFGLKDIEALKFHNIEYWFKTKVIKDLTIIKNHITSIEDKDIREFFLVPFSETVRLVSNTKSGEFKLHRIPKNKLREYSPNTLLTFKNKTGRNIERMKEFYKEPDSKVWVKILDEDTREKVGIPSESIDLVVTSPPYGDSRTTVAYGQFSRLSLEWLGLDGDRARTIDKKSLGGVPTNSLKNTLNSEVLNKVLDKIKKEDEKRAKDVLSFYIDLEKCFKEIGRVMKADGYICMVVGNRTVKKIQIPTDEIIVDLGRNVDFEHVETIVRNIPNKRMPSKNSPSNIPGEVGETMSRENIVIMKKMNTL